MKINNKEFITVKEMSDRLNISTNTIKQRLLRCKIKPVSKDALYDISALNVIKDAIIGRPKKNTKIDGAIAEPKKTKGKK